MDDSIGGVMQLVWMPTEIDITISGDFGLDVEPYYGQVGMGGTVRFTAEKVNARVFFPAPVLEPVTGDPAEKATVISKDHLVFDIEAGQTLTFKASSDKEIKLQYFVSHEVIGNVTEAVEVPPVFVIRKVNIIQRS